MLMTSRNRGRINAAPAPIDCCANCDAAKNPNAKRFYRRITKKADRRAWQKEVRDGR